MSQQWQWISHPDASTNPLPPPSEHSARVVGLGALCDLSERASTERTSTVRFVVGEYLDLDDATRVVLHMDRGLSLRLARSTDASELRWALTEGALAAQVLNVVAPDDAGAERHAWAELESQALVRGVRTSAAELRLLHYDVVFTEAVRRWLELHGVRS